VIVALIATRVAAEPVPDASLRAVKDRLVTLEREGAPAVEGRVIGFDETVVAIAVASTNEVVTVPRAHLVRVILADAAPSEAHRMIGVTFGLPGTIAVDADLRRWHAFASINGVFPILTEVGGSPWIAGAVGGGYTVPLSRHWRLDVFGTVLPLRTTSYYTYLGFGVGGGFHYTGPSGFTVDLAMPLLGFATRLGSSPYGYDAPFRYNDSLGYFYLGGFVGLPLATFGYRFATSCPI